MRRWIVEETGEVRSPKKGEWFINDVNDFMFMQNQFPCSPRKILKFTETTDVLSYSSTEKWVFERTGETRSPIEGEHFLGPDGVTVAHFNLGGKYPILRCFHSDICSVPSFDEWNW